MEIEQILLQIVGLLLLFLGMPLTQFLKTKLNLKDKVAMLLTGLVAVILALVQVFIGGEMSMQDFSLDNFVGAFGIIFTISQFWYRLLIKKDQ